MTFVMWNTESVSQSLGFCRITLPFRYKYIHINIVLFTYILGNSSSLIFKMEGQNSSQVNGIPNQRNQLHSRQTQYQPRLPHNFPERGPAPPRGMFNNQTRRFGMFDQHGNHAWSGQFGHGPNNTGRYQRHRSHRFPM